MLMALGVVRCVAFGGRCPRFRPWPSVVPGWIGPDRIRIGTPATSSSSTLLLLCDVCHRQTASLSDLQTYPCLHSFCVRCLNSHELRCCPICRTAFNFVQDIGGPVPVPPTGRPSQPPPTYNTTSSPDNCSVAVGNSSSSSSSGFNCQRYVEDTQSHPLSTSSRIIDSVVPRLIPAADNVHLVKATNGQNSHTSVVPQLSSLSICSSLRKIDISNVVLPLLPHYLPPSTRVCCAEYAVSKSKYSCDGCKQLFCFKCAPSHFKCSFSKNHGGCGGVDGLLHNSPGAKSSSSVSPVVCDVSAYARPGVSCLSSYLNCLTAAAANGSGSAFAGGYCR
ncbi:unnamed protein product [Soboliphyme baturini]|uniref:RING-type domain-containing protein n=1 Tax=Soboliphyme baturini TaxID=241478 RepID=A0A183IY04_9BILA|nr:unnamed protein product [Soboliphyme baturini]